MRGRFAPFVLGMSFLGLSVLLFLFAIYAFLLKEDFLGFLITAVIALPLGVGLRLFGKANAEPSRREALIGVLLLWLLIPALGAIPYSVMGGLSPINALFESMSGFTATGATVLTDFESFPKSLFLWRSLSQWFGGIGIIVLFIAVLPQLALAGRQLFFAEAPGPTEQKLSPRLRNTAYAVLYVYVGLTVACFLLYWLFGMSLFNAINHAFTTMGAAGFSPEGRSFEAFSPALSWVCIVFMSLAGMNFALLYQSFTGRPRLLFRDIEFRAYIMIALLAATILSLINLDIYSASESIRHGFFQALSILTTTGYASADFAFWSDRSQTVLLLLMFIGGSAGSAAGGVKVVRWLMIANMTSRELRQSLHPRGIFPVRLGERTIPEEVLRAVAAFMTLFIALFASITVVLVAFGADFVTAFSASIATVGNVGPGLGLVGPMESYATLHPVSRAALTFAMYAGRLEIVTVFLIFDPKWWRIPKKMLRR